jgi:hypothetical protein
MIQFRPVRQQSRRGPLRQPVGAVTVRRRAPGGPQHLILSMTARAGSSVRDPVAATVSLRRRGPRAEPVCRARRGSDRNRRGRRLRRAGKEI